MPWSFRDYIEPSGANPFAKWLSDIPEDAQAAITDRLLAMESLEKWPEKWASSYKGRPKIIELRIPWNKVQYRPLGVYSAARRKEFVLLCGAVEKGGKIPSSDLDTAERRRDDHIKNPERTVEHEY